MSLTLLFRELLSAAPAAPAAESTAQAAASVGWGGSVSAGLASGSGQAVVPAVKYGGSVAATATATATAITPSVNYGGSVTAGPAASTAAGIAAALSAATAAQTASASGSANLPTVYISVLSPGGNAGGTAIIPALSQSIGVTPAGGLAGMSAGYGRYLNVSTMAAIAAALAPAIDSEKPLVLHLSDRARTVLRQRDSSRTILKISETRS